MNHAVNSYAYISIQFWNYLRLKQIKESESEKKNTQDIHQSIISDEFFRYRLNLFIYTVMMNMYISWDKL